MTDPTVDHLRARLDETPSAIARTHAAATTFVAEHARALEAPRRWALSGIGASEGVARAAAAWIQREGAARAEFVPFSKWLCQPSSTLGFDGVVVFSQGMSPNARIATARAPKSSTRILVTASPSHPAALDARGEGWLLCTHEPADEGALLVRLTGPSCALTVARALADAVAAAQRSNGGGSLSAERAFERGVEVGRSIASAMDVSALEHVRAMLCAAGDDETHGGLAWVWMESTLCAPVALWDLLGFAHGPYQSLFDQRATLIALEQASHGALVDRVASMLDRDRHTLVRVRADELGPFTVFSHLGSLWALAIALLERRPRDLHPWPGKGRDKPLYDITE